MAKLYEPKNKTFDGKTLNAAYDKLSEEEQDTVDRQIDLVDTKLSKVAEERALAGDDRGAGGKTGFGRLSGLEVIAALGAWLNSLEDTDPEGLASLQKQASRPDGLPAFFKKDRI